MSTTKLKMSEEVLNFINLYDSLGTEASRFMPEQVVEMLHLLKELSNLATDDLIHLQYRTDKLVQELKDQIPGYTDVALLLYPHQLSKAFDYSAKKQKFTNRIKYLIDNDVISNKSKKRASQILNIHDFSIGNPPVTKNQLDFVYSIILGDNASELHKYKDVLGINDPIEMAQWNYLIEVLDQLITQNSHYTTKAEQTDFLNRMNTSLDFAGLNGFIKTLVSGTTETVVKLIAGEVFYEHTVKVVNFESEDALYQMIEGDVSRVFLVKIKQADRPLFQAAHWFQYLTRIILVDDSANAHKTNTSLVFSFNNLVINTLNRVHTKKLGAWANSQMNLRLILDKIHPDYLKTFSEKINQKIKSYEKELNEFKKDQLGEIDNLDKDIVLFKFDQFARQIIKDKYTLSKLNAIIKSVLVINDDKSRTRYNESLITEFEQRLSDYFYSGNPALQTATIIEGGGRNQIRTYGNYLLQKKLVNISKEVEERCRVIIDVIPDSYERTLQNHFHKNFGINLFLERYRDYMIIHENEADNKGRYRNMLIELGIYHKYKSLKDKEKKYLSEFLANLATTTKTSISDDAQMIIRDLIADERVMRPYVIWNQQQSWEYRDLIPENKFDINPFDIDVELKDDGNIDYDRLHQKLLRIKKTFQIFDESGSIWDKFCDNLSIIINDPNNPSGYTDFNNPELIEFLKFLSKTKITLLLDEAYNDAVKIDDPEEPKWRTISRYVLNNLSNYPKISIVASISTTKNLGSTGNRLGALVSTPAKKDVIQFAKTVNPVDKGNTFSLYMLVNLLEMAQMAKKVKDVMEHQLPKNASRSNIVKLIEKFIVAHADAANIQKESVRSNYFDGSPLHLFLLEELVSLDKLDILQIPDDFRYNDTPFFVYYLQELIRKLNSFRINRIFRNESNKRLAMAKKIVQAELNALDEKKLHLVDSDGSYLLNIKVIDFFSYQDLEKFAMKLAEERGISIIPYESGFLRFSVGNYIEGTEMSYQIFQEELSTALRILLHYWNLFYTEKNKLENKSLTTDQILQNLFYSPSEKDFMMRVFVDYDALQPHVKKGISYLKISNTKTFYNIQDASVGVSINAIPDSINAVIEFDDSVGNKLTLLEFIKSKVFSSIYDNLLPQIVPHIPRIKGWTLHRIQYKFGKATLLKYIENKLNFQPLQDVLDKPEDLMTMKEILLEIERLLFSDEKTKILAVHSTDNKTADVAKMEGINSILKKHFEEMLLHFNLPFAQQNLYPTYKELMQEIAYRFPEVTGAEIDEFNMSLFAKEISDLITRQLNPQSDWQIKVSNVILQLIQTHFTDSTIDSTLLLEAYFVMKQTSFIQNINDKMQHWNEMLAHENFSSTEVQLFSQQILWQSAQRDFQEIVKETFAQAEVKIYESDLFENTRKMCLFVISLHNRSKQTEYFTKFNHALIHSVYARFRSQPSSYNEIIQHGIAVYKLDDYTPNPLQKWQKGKLKWINEIASKTGVITAETSVQMHTRIATDAKKREYPIHRVDRTAEFKPDDEISNGSPYDFIKKLDTRPEADFFLERLKDFAAKLNPDEYRTKIFRQGLFNEMYVVHKSYLKYLTDDFRLLAPQGVSHSEVQNFVPEVLMFLGVPEKLMSFPQIGTFNIPGPNGNIKTVITPLRKETDYFGNVKKPRLTIINEKVKEIGGIPVHGSLFAVEEEDGSLFVVQISGDSGVGKSEMLAAMMLKWLKNNLTGVRSIKLIAGDMFHVFPDSKGNLYGIGSEIGDFSRVTDFDPEYIHAYNSLFQQAADSNVDDLNSRSTISGFCDISMPFKIDIMLTAYNYAKTEAGILRYDNPENFILYRDAHGERKEKATSEDGPNFLRTLMRYTSDKNIVEVIDLHGNYLDIVLDWDFDASKKSYYLCSSYKMLDKIDIEAMVNKIFTSKVVNLYGKKYTINQVKFDIIKNRFTAVLSDADATVTETDIDRLLFGQLFDTLASTPAGQPFITEIGQTDGRKHLIEVLKSGKLAKSGAHPIQLGILSTDLGKKGKEITGPRKAAEDMRKLIQEVRIERPDVNQNKQYVFNQILQCYPAFFENKNLINNEILRYNFYLYQLEQMRKAQIVKIDQRTEQVDLFGTYGFTPVDSQHEFSPLLVNVNLNIELNTATEAMEQLMTLPNSMKIAERLFAALPTLYFADSYAEDTILNNAVIQILLIEKYVNIQDIYNGKLLDKVSRELISIAKYVALKRRLSQK